MNIFIISGFDEKLEQCTVRGSIWQKIFEIFYFWSLENHVPQMLHDMFFTFCFGEME